MFRSYTKIFFRTFTKQPITSTINLLGLALGVASGIFVILYALDELSYDKFHQNGSNLYRVVSEIHDYNTDEILGQIETNGCPVGNKISEFPEVNWILYARSGSFLVVEKEGRKYNENLHFVGPSFFKTFTFPLVEGDPETCLEAPYSVAITQKMADKYFPEKNAR